MLRLIICTCCHQTIHGNIRALILLLHDHRFKRHSQRQRINCERGGPAGMKEWPRNSIWFNTAGNNVFRHRRREWTGRNLPEWPIDRACWCSWRWRASVPEDSGWPCACPLVRPPLGRPSPADRSDGLLSAAPKERGPCARDCGSCASWPPSVPSPVRASNRCSNAVS